MHLLACIQYSASTSGWGFTVLHTLLNTAVHAVGSAPSMCVAWSLSAVASSHFDETLRFGIRLQQYVWRQVNLAGGTNPQQLTSSASCGTAAAKACLLWQGDAQHIHMHGEPLWQTA